MRKLSIVAIVFLMSSVAFAGDSIKSPCGQAAVPTGSSDAVCVSVCSSGFAYNGCETSPAAATSSEESIGPAPSLEFLSIRVYGGKSSVTDLAVALERATGWTTEVSAAVVSDKLRPTKKRLKEDSQSIRVRLRDGGKVLVSVDEDQKRLRILSL